MYYVVEVSTTENGTAKAVTEKETLDGAKMLFHQVMASIMANNKVESGLCVVLDANGSTILSERHIVPKPLEGWVDVTNE